MAEKKISELTPLTGANAANPDLLAIVDVSAVETKNITREEFFKNLPPVQVTGGTINNTSVGATTPSTGAFTTLTSSSATLNGTTIPASKTLADTDSAQTLTNKTISGANNTLSDIANASLTNSSITFGSTPQALGSTVSALNNVSIGGVTPAAGAFTTLSATSGITGSLTGNADTATALQTARTIGGVSFDGTANINLPGVNQTGNQDTTGSAASLTTARTFTIGSTGKTFDGTASVSWTTVEIGAVAQTSVTGAALIPVGTEAQRPTPVTGQLRFNSDASSFEGYDGTAWGAIGGGGGATSDAIYENSATIAENITIVAGRNGMSTGPITINAGLTVTVSTGARYVVI